METTQTKRQCALGQQCLCKCKTLVAVGTSRANGKITHDDGAWRNMHKKCFKYHQEMQEIRAKQERLIRAMNNLITFD